MKPKLNREDYQFRKKTGQELIKTPGQLNGLDFLVSNCEDCTIYICDHAAQIFVDLSKNCKIFIGPVEGSIFIRKCENIEISAASSQFRVSNSNNIKCYVYTPSDPALEKSTGITFAPYNFSYPLVAEHFAKAKLDPNRNKWSEVFDFTPNFEQRNWTLLNPQEYQQVFKQIEGFDEPILHPVPIPTVYGGTCTKKIIVGSEDSNAQEKGGLDFMMGKTHIEQQRIVEEQGPVVEINFKSQTKADENIPIKSPAEPIQQQTYQYEEAVFDEVSVKSNEAQMNLQSYNQSYNTLQAFDEFQIHSEQPISVQRQKDEEEKQLKEKKRAAAKLYLKNFMSDLKEQTKQRQIQNRAQQIISPNEVGWAQVVKNIDLKNVTGEKNINEMAQAILNKAKDEQ